MERMKVLVRDLVLERIFLTPRKFLLFKVKDHVLKFTIIMFDYKINNLFLKVFFIVKIAIKELPLVE